MGKKTIQLRAVSTAVHDALETRFEKIQRKLKKRKSLRIVRWWQQTVANCANQECDFHLSMAIAAEFLLTYICGVKYIVREAKHEFNTIDAAFWSLLAYIVLHLSIRCGLENCLEYARRRHRNLVEGQVLMTSFP